MGHLKQYLYIETLALGNTIRLLFFQGNESFPLGFLYTLANRKKGSFWSNEIILGHCSSTVELQSDLQS
jgi:hypothetical protein